MTRSAIDEIRDLIQGDMELNVPMQTMTMIRTGGPADLVVKPVGREELAVLVKFLHSKKIAFRAIGEGSTVIVKDGGIRGAVLNLSAGFKSIEKAGEPEAPLVKVDAGVKIADLTDWTVENGLGGLEFLSGIPGTMGGAVFNDASGWGKSIGDCLVELEVMDAMGNIQTMSASELAFGDRRSGLPEGFIILSATVRGETRPSAQVDALSRNFHSRRRSNFPLGESAVGMVFRNVQGQPAEKLIDACGLKGIRAGDAEVSRLNSNFIVNIGNAEAGNVVSLIGMIQERVYIKYKVKLEAAVTIIGAWQKTKVRIKE